MSDTMSNRPSACKLLESINDDFACVRRLLGKPEACMAAEIMDVIRLAIDRLHNRYECLAHDVRIRQGETLAERDRCINIVRREAERALVPRVKDDLCKRIEAAIEGSSIPT